MKKLLKGLFVIGEIALIIVVMCLWSYVAGRRSANRYWQARVPESAMVQTPCGNYLVTFGPATH